MGVFKTDRLRGLQAQANPDVRRHTVMVVDDESANRTVMASILKAHYHVIEAADGRQALELLDQLGADVSLACIVSDQRMPNLTGVELLQRVHDLMPSTVRIIVTGYVDVDSIVDSINKAEIYKFIVKPFDMHDFLLTVRRGVEAFEMQQTLRDYQRGLEEQVRARTVELEASRIELLRTNADLEAQIAERERAQAALRRSSEQILALYNNASCGYHALDARGRIVRINDTELRWMGRRREDVVGVATLRELVSESSWQTLLARAPSVAHGWTRDLTEVELELVGVDGNIVPVLMNGVLVQEDGAPLLRCTLFNITERTQEEARLRHEAGHDPLTGLPNRRLMMDRIERALAQAERDKSGVGLLFIDLDHFKPVNDMFGHAVGDAVLRGVAKRLLQTVRKCDNVARFGGDEFVVSLAQLARREEVAAVADKILAALAQPFEIEGQVLQIGASIGAVQFPADGASLTALIGHADQAMYRAKQAGRNQSAFHLPPS